MTVFSLVLQVTLGLVCVVSSHATVTVSEKIRAAFNKMDTDGSGSLSLQEYAIGRGLSSMVARYTFSNADKNDDGKLDPSEFSALIRGEFDAFDRDGDGYISTEDLKKAFRNISEENTQNIINRSDTDGDNRISFEEHVDISV